MKEPTLSSARSPVAEELSFGGPRPSAPSGAKLRVLGFRFVLIYVALYCCPFPLDLLDASWLEDWVNWAPHAVVPWVGAHVLHLSRPITTFPNGSGDTTYNYVAVACLLVLSAMGAAVWSAWDRARRDGPWLREGLRVYLRYFVASTMFSYGVVKVLPLQFPPLRADRLLETYGQSSPMGLLWTFMGHSPAYACFGGALEIMGGALLLARRTAFLGALLVAAVMSNVVMLNLCYDVPVKLFSSHLLLMAAYIAAPDLPRFVRLFVLHLPTAPADGLRLRFPRRWMERARLGVKACVVLGIAYVTMNGALERYTRFGEAARRDDAFSGLYEVEVFEAPYPRWQRVVLSTRKASTVVSVFSDRGELSRYLAKRDETARSLTLTPFDGDGEGKLTYEWPSPDVLELGGTLAGQPLHARMRRVPSPSFPLMDRGFRWVNEHPYNR